ncbi:MAG: hypothetical protein JO250_11325 [Armatimonadetes bacterium]|nr:hypothetical protein [Armatimonadota bacterium]
MPAQATLQPAIEALHQQLAQDGKAQFQALITEQMVREAIRTARMSYVRYGLAVGSEAYVHKTLFPLFDRIAEDGQWPSGVEFSPFYELTDEHGTTYKGLGLSLEISTPDEPYRGFSLPILDVWYGRWV